LREIKLCHGTTIQNINYYIQHLKDEYNTDIEIINVSSTQGGYDLFYKIKK